MEDKNIRLKHSLNYGAVLGVFFVIQSLVLYFLGMSFFSELIIQKITSLIMILTISIMAIRSYRIMFNDGFITYGQAFKVSLTVIASAALIDSLYQYIFVAFIESNYIELYQGRFESFMLNVQPEITDEQLSEMSKGFKDMNAWDWAFGNLRVVVIFGLVLSLITSAFLKKDNPEMI